jgi:hypothetical protein
MVKGLGFVDFFADFGLEGVGEVVGPREMYCL